MNDFWNQRYSAEEYVYGREPSEFLKQYLQDKPPGTLLLPCEGEGRNAVYAARLGWKVVAFDQSEAGRDKAMKLAAEAGVHFDYHISSAEDFRCTEKFDLIALLWAHFGPEVRAEFHKKMTGCLKDGGHLILEAFNKKQISFTSGGPKDPDLLFSVPLLESDFSDLHILHLAEEQTHIDESDFHRGMAEVIRFVGRK
jgi:cyclopropane fatty-acyl-phospholipid synthase-like methyltransferase